MKGVRGVGSPAGDDWAEAGKACNKQDISTDVKIGQVVMRPPKSGQSIVDADTAPGKRESYRRLLETEISDEPAARAAQLDANPGLWVRLHPNVRSLILPSVLESQVG